jgi:predicted DNA-binding transcriptional regulator AlpA
MSEGRTAQTEEDLLDVKEAAAVLNVPESVIYQHVRARAEEKPRRSKMGKHIGFSAKALTHCLEARHLGGEVPSMVGHDW